MKCSFTERRAVQKSTFIGVYIDLMTTGTSNMGHYSTVFKLQEHNQTTLIVETLINMFSSFIYNMKTVMSSFDFYHSRVVFFISLSTELCLKMSKKNVYASVCILHTFVYTYCKVGNNLIATDVFF